MSDNGIALFDIESLWLSPATKPETIRPALEICAALGGKNLLIAGNDPEPDRMAANFAAISSTGGGIPRSRVYRADLVVRGASSRSGEGPYPARRRQRTLGVIIDTLHMDRGGETPASIAAFDPTLIAYVQICDAGSQRPASPPDLMAEARGNQAAAGRRRVAARRNARCLAEGPDLGVEAPTQELAALPFAEAARRAGDATRAFFAMREAHN